MEEKVTEIRRLVTKAALRVIDLDQIQVDTTYQREVKAKHKRIVSDFCEEALGIPLVGEREDSSLWIVDGFQRITALRKLNKTKVRAEVFKSRGTEHEAEIFKLVNQNRTALNPAEIFRALLAAHDKQAWRIKEAVEECGYVLSLNNGQSGSSKFDAGKRVGAISTLVQLDNECGIEPIKFALNTAKICWPGDALGVSHNMISGLAKYFHHHEGLVNTERLYPRLQSVTAHKILYNARMLSDVGSGGYRTAVENEIEKISRKILRKSK